MNVTKTLLVKFSTWINYSYLHSFIKLNSNLNTSCLYKSLIEGFWKERNWSTCNLNDRVIFQWHGPRSLINDQRSTHANACKCHDLNKEAPMYYSGQSNGQGFEFTPQNLPIEPTSIIHYLIPLKRSKSLFLTDDCKLHSFILFDNTKHF